MFVVKSPVDDEKREQTDRGNTEPNDLNVNQ